MILAQDLRIGNLVYKNYPDGVEIITVAKISKNFVNGLGISAIQPIELTEEILDKLDFGCSYTKFNNGFYISEYDKTLKYLHKLQNIHYETYNQELEIKL